MDVIKENERNIYLDLGRIIFSILIIFTHYRCSPGVNMSYFTGGYIGVEFFFVLSGFWLALDVSREQNKDIVCATLRYIKKRIKKFFPYMMVSYIVGFCIYHSKTQLGVAWIKDFLFSFGEISMISMFGLRNPPSYTSGWYLSALLIASFILFYVYKVLGDKFIGFYAPLLVLWGLGYYYQNFGGFENGYIWNGICFSGLLRAIIEMTIGIIAYNISQKINVSIIGRKKYILQCFGIMSILTVVVVCVFMKDPWIDYILLLLISFGIATISSITKHIHKKTEQLIIYIANLTLPMFLCHGAILYMYGGDIQRFFGGGRDLIVILFLVAFIAICEQFIVEIMLKIIRFCSGFISRI